MKKVIKEKSKEKNKVNIKDNDTILFKEILKRIKKLDKIESNIYMYILPIRDKIKLSFLEKNTNVKNAIIDMLNYDMKNHELNSIEEVKYIDISIEYASYFRNNSIGCIGYYRAKKFFPNSKVISLFYLGNINLLKYNKIGIIGARECSKYSAKISSKFSKKLVENKIVTVSGLALGIDTTVHISSKINNEYLTIAILGTGFSKNAFYPKVNYGIFQDIILNGGLVISEYLPDYMGNRFTFPRRNRLIADLSSKLIVIEAKDKSGSMITINYALDYGKDIFVVPGNIDDSRFSGSNHLIKDGANILTDEKDLEDIVLNLNKIKD